MKMNFLGIDTSCYRTSLAVVDQGERLLWEERLSLTVDQGQRGIRQSRAVFEHLLNVPRLLEAVEKAGLFPVAAVGAAVKPRPLPDSYMPVFKVGESFGRGVAASSSLRFFPTTHQEGHIAAGFWSSGLREKKYLVLHVSGGTTELLIVEHHEGMEVSIIGGTEDLNAGQFIDRLGVEMGLAFPSGPMLEELAGASQGEIKLPVAVRKTKISFSGPATQASRFLQQGCSQADLARAIEVCIADSLVECVKAAIALYEIDTLLVVGGVVANGFIRCRMRDKLKEMHLFFADSRFSGDNAVGVALLTCRNIANS